MNLFKHNPILNEIKESFRLDLSALQDIAEDFYEELILAVNGQPSSLQALPSYLPTASGKEQGNFITIDFGGTNIRVSSVTLQGNGSWSVRAEVRKPLRDPNREYDLTTTETSGTEVFDFVADLIAQVYNSFPSSQIGMTFSYPMVQHSKNEARLLRWTKELQPHDTIGERIDLMLTESIRRRGLAKLSLAAIINDTTACALAASYQPPAVKIGSICGTGHNSCCLYPYFPEKPPVIINLESGNFNRLPLNGFDKRLHQHTLDPDQQHLEKMVAGKYLGEMWRLILWELIQKDQLPEPSHPLLQQPFAVSSEPLSYLYADPWGNSARQWYQQAGIDHYQPYQLLILQDISAAVIHRAIGLIAASYAGILKSNSSSDEPAVIAVDGSVFRFLPGFKQGVEQQLANLHPDHPPRLLLTPEGSSIGAAVAAALPSV